MPDHASTRRLLRATPNALTTLRLVFVVALPLSPPHWRLPIVVVAGVTDFLDGLMARRFGATSRLGGMLDAVTDKLFTLSAIFTLTLSGDIRLWQGGIALSRDGAVLLAVVFAGALGEWGAISVMMPSRFGKWATAFFFLWFAVELTRAPVWAQFIAFALAGGCSALAAIGYMKQTIRALRSRRKG